MKQKLSILFVTVLMVGGMTLGGVMLSKPVQAADIEAGKKKAAVCVACHGQNGISLIPLYPNLKGQKAAYTVKQLKAFKNKQRPDPVMAAQAASLSDEDMANIAAYYESLGQ